MTAIQIQFYHLLTTPLEVALPKLVAKAYAQDYRLCIVGEPEMLERLDQALWSYDPASFLPHGRTGGEYDAQHPILLSPTPTQTNQATLLLITNGLDIEPESCPFARVLDMFDGHDTPPPLESLFSKRRCS
jgi:DNA polymerase-3 subunit chi